MPIRVPRPFAIPEQHLRVPLGLVIERYQPRPCDHLQAHCHPVDCVNLVLDGTLVEERDRQTHTLSAGTLSLLARGQSHAVHVSGQVASVLHIEYPSSFLDRLPLAQRQPGSRVLLDARTRALAQRFRDELRWSDGASSLALEALAVEAWMLLMRTRVDASAPAWLQRYAADWRAQPGRALSIAADARVLGLAPASLSRAFRTHYGQRIPDFVHGLRMERAAESLIHSEASLAQIATSLGYVDQSHFSRAFQRGYGMPPSRWRRLRQSVDA